eukprot:Colp12_sorted_trinity150504_noHs@9166
MAYNSGNQSDPDSFNWGHNGMHGYDGNPTRMYNRSAMTLENAFFKEDSPAPINFSSYNGDFDDLGPPFGDPYSNPSQSRSRGFGTEVPRGQRDSGGQQGRNFYRQYSNEDPAEIKREPFINMPYHNDEPQPETLSWLANFDDSRTPLKMESPMSIPRPMDQGTRSADTSQYRPRVTLVDPDNMWKQFSKHTTEMIITKYGRCLFPILKIRVEGLDPTANYSILLDFPAVCNTRWKFNGKCWVDAGTMERAVPASVYIHPDSPNTGGHWMEYEICFAKVKLTNKPNEQGHIVLNSFQRYRPRFHIVRLSDDQDGEPAVFDAFSFPETEFVAVTTYQNEAVKDLKKAYNPFAKAFKQDKEDGEGGEDEGEGGAEEMMVEEEAPPEVKSEGETVKRVVKKRKSTMYEETTTADVPADLPPAVVASYIPEVRDYNPAEVHILVVDDDAVTTMYINTFLKSFGFQVTTCENGQAAYNILQTHGSKINLVLSDCRMPVLDGFSLVQKIHSNPTLKGLPVILMSERGGSESADKAINLGSDDYLMKPVSK